MSRGAKLCTHGWRRGWIVVSYMTRTHFKVLIVPAASYCLWDPDPYSWQTMCVHRAASAITMNSSSELLLDSLRGCVAAIYQPETQLQGTLISTLKRNSRTLTCLLLSLQHAGKVVALVGGSNRIAFQCFSCCGRYSWFTWCLDWIFLKPHHVENVLILSFLQSLSLLFSWCSFSLPCWSAFKIVRSYVSLSPFVKQHGVSPWIASDSGIVFSKYKNCLENYFCFRCNNRNGPKISLPFPSSSWLRCEGDFAVGETSEKAYPSLIKPIFSPSTLLLLRADIFLKREDWVCWYYQAAQNITKFLHLYFCLRVTTLRFFFRILCLIKCCCLSPHSVTLNYSGRLKNESFLSSKKSLKIT